jgi:hypothetical protein
MTGKASTPSPWRGTIRVRKAKQGQMSTMGGVKSIHDRPKWRPLSVWASPMRVGGRVGVRRANNYCRWQEKNCPSDRWATEGSVRSTTAIESMANAKGTRPKSQANSGGGKRKHSSKRPTGSGRSVTGDENRGAAFGREAGKVESKEPTAVAMANE